MIGIDEVGRGSWAGPLLVVAARQTGTLPKGLADSKVLSKKRREALFYDIQIACDLGEGWVTPAEIDANGLTAAMRLGVARALAGLRAQPGEEIIMDGNFNYCDAAFVGARCVIDADATHPIVSAASIYAKVVRDNYMTGMAKKFPHYNFHTNVGYGTRFHQEMIKLHGVCELHRLSWSPLRPDV